MGNPFQYVSRTFNTILADINSDPDLADKPDWSKRMIAGLGDIFSMMLNAEANNNILRTAFTRQAVSDLLQLIDYELTEQITSSGTLLFYIPDSASFPFAVAQSDLAALSQSSGAASSKRFEGRAVKNVAAVSETITDSEVTPGADTLTVTRDYTTGEKVKITAAAPPAPLVTLTSYYVIRIDATTIKLATTIANAYAGTAIDITTTGTGNIVIDLYSFTVTAWQQEQKASQSIGTSDGVTEFQEFDIPDLNMLKDTLAVTINSLSYTRVDTLIESASIDKDYETRFNSDLSSKLLFGNGTYGILPPAFDIDVVYAVGGGVDSNIGTLNRINIYAGSDSNIEGVSNSTTFTGGAAEIGIETGKVLGPLLLKARNRFVTGEDGEALALAFGGSSQVQVNENVWGVLSSQVLGIASGGGNLSAPIKAALQTYLIERTILESIDARVEDATITAKAVTSAAKMRSGFVYADEEVYFDLAWQLFFTETGKEIYDLFLDSGIVQTVTLINTIFSTLFGESDYDQVQNLVEALNPILIGYRTVGEDDIQESDAFAYVAGYVFSIDYITIGAPAFPIALADDEITTVGALTTTEIP